MLYRRRLRAIAARRGDAHIYSKYGRDRAALTAPCRAIARAALHEAGKVLAGDPIIVDCVAKKNHRFDSKADLLARFAEAGLDVEASINQQWVAFATALLSYPQTSPSTRAAS
ncbi:hypothetical protein ACS0X5_24840 [Burkholderia gladioli]|uniref:hypothetical protein n=1 Tax=Burkholderia gladioli TaxID=28095 RepID=UPI00031FE77A|nr:hypothetical protein [Burkholderia gladioli]